MAASAADPIPIHPHPTVAQLAQRQPEFHILDVLAAWPTTGQIYPPVR
jgi:hypothetical protein